MMKHSFLDAAEKKRFSARDWYFMPLVSGISASESGKYISYTCSRFVLEGDEPSSVTVICDENGKELLRLPGVSGGFWKNEDFYCINEGYLKKYDLSGTVEVISAVSGAPSCCVPFRNGYLLVRDEAAETDGYTGFDENFLDVVEYPWKRDGHGYCNRTRAALVFMEPDKENPRYRLLSFPYAHVCQTLNGFGSAPMTVGDRYIYYWADTFDKMPSARAAVYCLDYETGENRMLAPVGDYQLDSGALLNGVPYFIATDMHKDEMRYMNAVIVGVKEGEIKEIHRPEEGMLGKLSPMGEGFLVNMPLNAYGKLFSWKPGERMTSVCESEYDISGGICTAKGRIYASARKAGGVAELCEVTKEGIKLLTDHTSDFTSKFKFPLTEKLSVPGGEGCTVEGWVLKPVGYEPGRKYPGILMIHGGPEGWYNGCPSREMYTLSAEGYFVFYCNPRGSGSYSRKHLVVDGHYGTYDFDNIMDFTSAVLLAYPDVDESRMGVTGGSYGGFMTNWIIGHTDRFAAAVSCRSISDWTTMCGTTDIPWFPRLAQRGEPWNDRGMLWDKSPLKYACDVKTPTLFLQNKDDFRCPAEQAYIMFSALLHHNVRARLVMNNDASHSNESPAQREHDMNEMLCWFEEHMPQKQ